MFIANNLLKYPLTLKELYVIISFLKLYFLIKIRFVKNKVHIIISD